MGKLFGTDGIRGLANMYPMTPEMMVKLGMVVGSKLQKRSSGGILIGRDSRLSGPMLESALAAGILASGTDVYLAGILPTPAIAFLTTARQAKAGAVISASHNPARDNGVKFFASDGYKLSDDFELAIEYAVLEDRLPADRPTGGDIGSVYTFSNAGEQYVEHAITSVFGGSEPDFRDMKVVVDCANGAAYKAAPMALARFQLNPIVLSASPDGLNINQNCGTLHTETLQQWVRQEQADLGIAFDGDADRLILVDERGNKVDGDRIMAMLALDLSQKQELNNNTLVVTVMSNLGLEIAMKEAGIHLERTPVGDRHVIHKMRELGANLGGEQAGHIVMFDHGTTGDGLVTALAVLQLMRQTGKPLSELAECMTTFPQKLVNIPVNSRIPIEEMESVSEAIRQVEQELGERGRVLVRYSGTELLARVMIEAEDDDTVARTTELIAEEIRKENR